MILDYLRLENVGAYHGLQEAVLTPGEGQPVILFGGMNGGGKTTLLDALQLVLYGSRARLSNRGRQGYRDYLQGTIHRNADPGEGASILLRFRRVLDGVMTAYEVERSWRVGVRGIEESFRVLRDGELDAVATDHWDEIMEAYLPASISNLFFFDGEQIKDLAEGENAAAILGTAIRSLLGLDLVDRLDADLRVFERRKKAEALDEESTRQLAQAEAEAAGLLAERERLTLAMGGLVNEAGRLSKEVREREKRFQDEGGDLFLRRRELESGLADLEARLADAEEALRQLAAGPLPLLMVEPLLGAVESQVHHESEIRQNRVLVAALEERDAFVLERIRTSRVGTRAISRLAEELSADRERRRGVAHEEILFDAGPGFAAHLAHLRARVLPEAVESMQRHLATAAGLREQIARAEAELARVPEAASIARFQYDLESARQRLVAKQAEIDAHKVRIQVLDRQIAEAEARIDRFGDRAIDARAAEDGRRRMIHHSQRVRQTLVRFRTKVIQRHVANMEVLMLDSFRQLLRKADLVHGLSIDPESFRVTLTDRNGHELPFDRLSAGERQLLATALLWGLARASGRPIPTVIDTPLGRLDSSHRRHLVERYFPRASHQVILLSTDEEIVGRAHKSLEQHVARHYLLTHDEALGHTSIQEGYFSLHEASR